jgi:hypothetical protein
MWSWVVERDDLGRYSRRKTPRLKSCMLYSQLEAPDVKPLPLYSA